MKTIVLFFVLFAFAAVTAKHNKNQKAKEYNDEDISTPSQPNWPQPVTLGEFGVPDGYDGPATGGGHGPGGPPSPGATDVPSGKSHERTSRRHN